MASTGVVSRRLPPTARLLKRQSNSASGTRSTFDVAYFVMIGLFVCALALLTWWGSGYYATPLAQRLDHPLHALLRPSGAIGRNLGIAGTLMMAAIFLYTLRKKLSWLQRIGTQPQWLKVHIFLGFAGPVLVTYHTSGKLNGLVAIAFYSMWAIVASGIVGRYLYAKIPRTIKGSQMTLQEIEKKLAELVSLLQRNERKEVVLRELEAFLARTRLMKGGMLRTLGRVAKDDLSIPFDAVQVWRIIGSDGALTFSQRFYVSRLVVRQKRMLNHLAVLDASKKMFAYWHIFHRPFTVITIVIVSFHVAVEVYFGYGIDW